MVGGAAGGGGPFGLTVGARRGRGGRGVGRAAVGGEGAGVLLNVAFRKKTG